MTECKHPPILHLNGSGYENLSRQYRAVFDHLSEALEFAYRATPHNRDYYVSQDKELHAKAVAEYNEQILRIADINQYFASLLMNIIDQESVRQARKRPSATTSPLDGAPIEDVPVVVKG